ncbi:MAG: efflux RND transporter periplasmic adaptor subunit [Candidatus Aminicenantes bacterium]|nr:efflux RND transporter periplasmic adaptor subunit [Candidatus Aminicenantes bacterium]
MKRKTILLLAIFVLVSCGEKGKENVISSTATIEAVQVRISPIYQARIKNIPVKEGERVKKGDVLAILDSREFELKKKEVETTRKELFYSIASLSRQIEELGVRLKQVEKTYERAKNLYKEKAIPLQKFEETETEYLSLQKRLQALKENRSALKAKIESVNQRLELFDYYIDNSEIKAPIDGIVQEIVAREGEVVLPTSTILTLAKMDEVWARMYVEERYLGFIKIGQKAKIKVDSFPNREFSGKVIWVAEEAEFIPKNVQTQSERATLVYAVKVSIDNKKGIFKIGMPVEIFLEK